MKKFLTLLLVCLLVLSSCTFTFFNKTIMTGDRNVLPRSYDMSETNLPYKVVIKNIEFINFEAVFTVDENLKDELVITTDENIFESFKIDYNTELHSITITGDSARRYSPSEFEITVGGLVDRIDISGAFVVDMKFNSIKNPELIVSGAVKGKIDINKGEDFSFIASGAAGVDFSGETTKFSATLSGAANIKGYELICDIADITLSGAGLIELTVTREISADISGTAVFKYRGNAEIVKKEISGLGEIIKAEY